MRAKNKTLARGANGALAAPAYLTMVAFQQHHLVSAPSSSAYARGKPAKTRHVFSQLASLNDITRVHIAICLLLRADIPTIINVTRVNAFRVGSGIRPLYDESVDGDFASIATAWRAIKQATSYGSQPPNGVALSAVRRNRVSGAGRRRRGEHGIARHAARHIFLLCYYLPLCVALSAYRAHAPARCARTHSRIFATAAA